MKMNKPWLGVVALAETNDDGTKNCGRILYYTETPVLADMSSEVRKIVFAEAVKAHPDLNPADMEVYAIPFALPS